MRAKKIILSLLFASYQLFITAAAEQQDITKAPDKEINALRDILPISGIQQLVADYIANKYETVSHYNAGSDIKKLAISANGKIVAFITENISSEPKLFVLEWVGNKFKLIYEKNLASSAQLLAISPDGRSIGIILSTGLIHSYGYDNNTYVKKEDLQLSVFSEKNILFFECDHITYLITMDSSECVGIRKRNNDFSFEEIQTLTVPGYHHKGALSKNGDVLAVSNSTGEIYIYRFDNQTKKFNDKPVAIGKVNNLKNFALSSQGKYIAVNNDQSIRIGALEENKFILIDTIPHTSVVQIALSPDGTKLCVVHLDSAQHFTWKINIWEKNITHKFEVSQTILSESYNQPIIMPFILDGSYLMASGIINKSMNIDSNNLYVFRNDKIALESV
jgi:WD40 repeat protein